MFNMFNHEIEFALKDMLFLEREYKMFLRFKNFVSKYPNSDTVRAEQTMINLARGLATGYNRIYCEYFYPVPARNWTEANYKQSTSRLVRK